MVNNLDDNFIITTLKSFIKSDNGLLEHAYAVGGFVRDCMIAEESCDVDIVVDKGFAKDFSKKLADTIEGFFVELDDVNNIYRVVFPDKINYVDVADCTGESIEEDLKRRDFTMNALAYDLGNNSIIDVTGGLEDLKKGIIREISTQNILEDPIRILRAFRFQSQLGFDLSEELKTLVKEHGSCLNATARERVNAELLKLFGGKEVVKTLHALDDYKLLELIIPETVEIKKVPPNSHHHLGLFEHSIETVRQIQCYYDKACDEVKEHLVAEFLGGHKRICYLKLAAFLHDVGKPYTWQIEPDTGRHRFIMHDCEGAKCIVPTLKNLKFSKKQIAYIQKIIKNHIYPAGVVTSDEAGEKAYLRFYRKMEDETIDLIAIAYADRMSALGPDITSDMINKNLNGLQTLLEGYLAEKSKLAPLPKLLDGKEIMELLNITASPKLGEIISQLKEAQISSEVNTREEAINFIKKIEL